MGYRKKYLIGFFIFAVLFCILLCFSGFFKIGLLSDDYLNFYDASHSTTIDKLTGNLPFSNPGHFRPVYYTSLEISTNLHNALGFSYDNFIIYRIQNLLVYLVLTFLAGWIVLLKTQNFKFALLAGISIAVFPNNIHNICWTAGRVDLLCSMFYLLSIYFAFIYIKCKSTLKAVFAVLFFILALMTKETALTLPFVLSMMLMFEQGIKSVKKFLPLILLFFGVLFSYIIYRLVILNPGYNKFYEADVLSVMLKSLVSLSIPLDYLTLKMEILDGYLWIYAYLAILLSGFFTYLLICLKKDIYRPVLYAVLLTAILLVPYIYIGYIRPQIILLPFTVITLYIFLSFDKIKNHFKKVPFKILLTSVLILLIFWINIALITVKDWSYAFTGSLSRIEALLQTNLESNRKIIIIGNAGRFKQSLMFDKLTGAYNYWKFNGFTVKDTINDIVQTAALDEISLNSKINYKIIQPGEYEISVTGKTQFFYMEGFNSEISTWKFSDKNMEVEAIENTFLDKPTKIRIKILSKDANCYLATEMNYFKIY